MEIKNHKLKQRILEISRKRKLSHLSSCLTSVDIIQEIYSQKAVGDKFILSNGHAGLALYVVLENYHFNTNAEDLLETHGIHPSLDDLGIIHCSTGSLGLGITVAVGYALADRSRDVYCLLSDGESFEGSVWESLNFIHNARLHNLKVYININGASAYDSVDSIRLIKQCKSFLPAINIRQTNLNDFPRLQEMGLEAHYHCPKLLPNGVYDV